ncbi:MAG: CBS domain-containing protein [Beijerinckiaceae bacterium]
MSKIKDRPEFRSKAPVMTFAPDTMVSVAVKAMSAKNYGAAVITDTDRKPIGIVTERDFMRRLLDQGLDPATTPLSQIMTRDLKIGRAEDTMIEWVRQMSNERFRHVPIVDDDGRLINIMSQGDFVSYSWPEMFGLLKDQAVRNMTAGSQVYIIIGGIAVYSLALIALMRWS